MTHDIMESHPVAGQRFGNILHCSHGSKSSNEPGSRRKFNRSVNNEMSDREKMSGYTGHVPRRNFYCGKGYQEECRRGIADFERLQMDRRDTQARTKYFPPEDLLPRTLVFPKRLCERPEHRSIPSYATFTNPMNYGMSVFDMSDLDPRKTSLTSKYCDVGVTRGKAANQTLCDLSSSRWERMVAERRPKIDDWYRSPNFGTPDPYPLDGYHPPAYQSSKPVPGYAGHVPGYRDCCSGETFGQSAGSILRDKDLVYYNGLRKP
ncbi:uncharacterized protein LOC129226731 [Uloborus diversus]|uniref:uncharacterized protein LOC129226731 n=1 Tax=Uloborus diversus TaxID=327109 RepID=UPI0024090EDA|nr:uncharacterized protein LOC129226731 [Uloborus diversus]